MVHDKFSEKSFQSKFRILEMLEAHSLKADGGQFGVGLPSMTKHKMSFHDDVPHLVLKKIKWLYFHTFDALEFAMFYMTLTTSCGDNSTWPLSRHTGRCGTSCVEPPAGSNLIRDGNRASFSLFEKI